MPTKITINRKKLNVLCHTCTHKLYCWLEQVFKYNLDICGMDLFLCMVIFVGVKGIVLTHIWGDSNLSYTGHYTPIRKKSSRHYFFKIINWGFLQYSIFDHQHACCDVAMVILAMHEKVLNFPKLLNFLWGFFIQWKCVLDVSLYL